MAGQVDEGLAMYEEAIETCDTYGPAYYNVGVVHSENKEVNYCLLSPPAPLPKPFTRCGSNSPEPQINLWIVSVIRNNITLQMPRIS